MTLFHDQAADPARKQALIKQGVRCISIDTHEYGLDLKKVIESIGQDGIHDLWVEAGGQCFAALTRQKLIQRAFIYLAPRWLGDGQAAFEKTFSFDFSTAQIHWKQVGKDALCEIRW
jgi:diaminohydroxyphosphoribosylaminopyrimidine deaminase/5-amino-6-(5-phosphoribosylamino)uracil reductase